MFCRFFLNNVFELIEMVSPASVVREVARKSVVLECIVPYVAEPEQMSLIYLQLSFFSCQIHRSQKDLWNFTHIIFVKLHHQKESFVKSSFAEANLSNEQILGRTDELL